MFLSCLTEEHPDESQADLQSSHTFHLSCFTASQVSTMARKSDLENPKKDTYPLFSFSNASQLGPGFGLLGASQNASKPPCVEVPLFEFAEEVPIKSLTEPIVVADGQHRITLFKGRVSTADVFGNSKSDLVPGKYEGGLKLWEGSIDLLKTLYTEIQERRLIVDGKRVLEIGCGHGLPGIFTALKGASTIHFQDFNAEVLQFLTIPNAKANLFKNLPQVKPCESIAETNLLCSVRFFAGDWSDVHGLLLHGCNDGHQIDDGSGINDDAHDGYDIILMAETVYALSSLQNLYELIKKCLGRAGVVYMAGKKHYFGVGGGTRQFINLVEVDGQMKTFLLAEVADGSSNVREVWKLSYKQAVK